MVFNGIELIVKKLISLFIQHTENDRKIRYKLNNLLFNLNKNQKFLIETKKF